MLSIYNQRKPSYIQGFTCLISPFLGGVEVLTDSQFGDGTGPIFLNQLQCTGTETSLLRCRQFTELGLHFCDHSQDVGVRCIGKEVFFFYKLTDN